MRTKRLIWIPLAAATATASVGFFTSASPASAMPPWWECTALAGAIDASRHGGELSGNPFLIDQYQEHCTVWE